MMSAYFVAQIRVDDPVEYQKYLDSCDAVFAKFQGEYLAVDEAPEVLEGEWGYTKTVIIRFPSARELRRWYDSPEYQVVCTHRLAAARCDTLMVRGLDEGR